MARSRSIREYANFEWQLQDPTSWLGRPEIPSPNELNGDGDDPDAEIEIPVNNIGGPWQSITEYLSAHYRLLREDAVAPLRNVVSEVRAETGIMEKDSQENASIYEKVCRNLVTVAELVELILTKVHIIGLTFSVTGIAARITFSLRRSGKRVPWEQSKRLITGSVVALTPAHDMFEKICRVAIVAARPLAGVQQNPPEIDIIFATPDQIELDPRQEWVMVECRDGYFEGSRHTLRALQKLTNERYRLVNSNRRVKNM
jgi:helicase required for RNAi-mediated heterochromatin assembly 1